MIDDVQQLHIERRLDGSLVVRVRSRERADATLPDAVFSFRAGDPQFDLWLQRYEGHAVEPLPVEPSWQTTFAAPPDASLT
jgi:hypothetical protein